MQLEAAVYTGPARVERAMTIRGAGAGKTIVQQLDSLDTPLTVDTAGRVVVEDVGFRGIRGKYKLHPAKAGAIHLVDGVLVVRRAELTGIIGYGLGAIDVERGTLHLEDSKVTGTIGNAGNVITSWKKGSVVITRTDFSGNDKVPLALGGVKAQLVDVRFLNASQTPPTWGLPSDIVLMGEVAVTLQRVQLGAGVQLDVRGRANPVVTLEETHWIGVGPEPARLIRADP
ncbi:MAG: hypothetical protein RIT81_10070 [Deltaproteobacteria bacterium]